MTEVDEVIINLNILSTLDPNKKLNTKEIYLNVEVGNLLLPEFIKRWYRGDDRDEAIKKIDLIINKAISLLENNEIIKEHLDNCIKGIENLKETYSQDIQTKARLDTIIEKITNSITNSRNKTCKALTNSDSSIF